MNISVDFKREITSTLVKLANSFPIVCITGPRQSGKTTLARQHFSQKKYINLEDPDQREQVIHDPKGTLTSLGKEGAIFDEIQHFPELLSYLQALTDELKIRGQFIITGSYNFALLESVTQSLAGRVGLLELFPMSTQELIRANIILSTDEKLFYGGLPRIFRDHLDPTLVYKNYVKTYLERDLRQVIHVADLVQFQRFMKLCAARIGSEFIASNIANELGISYHTVQSWLSVLEASYIVFRLQPYFENFGKRIIKSSKLYFSDIGLACYLLGIENISHIERDPLKGKWFENLVILDIYKQLLNLGREPNLYFYRDQSQHEIDLIWQYGRTLIPIEIKYGQTFKTAFTKELQYFKKIVPDRVAHGYVIYTGTSLVNNNHHQEWKLLNYCDSNKIILNAYAQLHHHNE